MTEDEFRVENDLLKKRLDELTSKRDITETRGIQDYQRKHVAYINKKYGRFMSQFEMYFSALVAHTHHQNYIKRSHWPTHRAIQFSMTVHALKPMYSAYVLFCNGFYEDSMILLRSVYETSVRILYITCNPKQPYHGLVRDKSLPKWSITNFINQELKLDWTQYGIMSMFHHSNWIAVVDSLIENQNSKDPKAISLLYELNEDMIGLVTNNFLFLMSVYMNFITRLFVVDYTGHPKAIEELEKAKEYSEILIQNLKTHSANTYWRQVGKDVEDIFKLIEWKEKNINKNWKTEWKKIRTA